MRSELRPQPGNTEFVGFVFLLASRFFNSGSASIGSSSHATRSSSSGNYIPFPFSIPKHFTSAMDAERGYLVMVCASYG